MLEKTIEQRGCALAKKLGFIPLKIGNEGWPDRLILLNYQSRHIWIEFKKPGGKLRPAQKRLIHLLQLSGDHVYVVYTVEECKTILNGYANAIAIEQISIKGNREDRRKEAASDPAQNGTGKNHHRSFRFNAAGGRPRFDLRTR